MCEDIRTSNRCYKECPLWEDQAACGKVQPERNCYQCPIASEPGLKKSLDAWRKAAEGKFGLRDILDLCKEEGVEVTVAAGTQDIVWVRVTRGGSGAERGISREELERALVQEKWFAEKAVKIIKGTDYKEDTYEQC